MLPYSNTKQSSISENSSSHLSTPTDFHSKLCHLIRNAKERVILASLYIGAGGCVEKYPKENEFLDAIEYVSSKSLSRPKISILLDANRSLRPIRNKSNTEENTDEKNNELTSSAEIVYRRLSSNISSVSSKYAHIPENKLYLFNVLDFPYSLLPSPLNEVVGVFHLKAYVIDDTLILSGANLSEEYFTDRQDRYMCFINGGNGLVDFYADLINILSEYAYTYESTSGFDVQKKQNNHKSKRHLIDSLSSLFDGSQDKMSSACMSNLENRDVIAYAIPTFQLPKAFSRSLSLPFPSDVQVLQRIIQTVSEEFQQHVSIRLSTAYLNPTKSLMNAFKSFGRKATSNQEEKNNEKSIKFMQPTNIFLLSAGPLSHGFAPKKKAKQPDSGNNQTIHRNGKDRDWIANAFSILANAVATQIKTYGGKILLFERKDWTFHAKGLWLSTSSIEYEQADNILLNKNDDLLLVILGSGNYGTRSEELDLESNCVLVLNTIEEEKVREDDRILRKVLVDEWNFMCRYSQILELPTLEKNSKKKEPFILRLALPILKRYL